MTTFTPNTRVTRRPRTVPVAPPVAAPEPHRDQAVYAKQRRAVIALWGEFEPDDNGPFRTEIAPAAWLARCGCAECREGKA